MAWKATSYILNNCAYDKIYEKSNWQYRFVETEQYQRGLGQNTNYKRECYYKAFKNV